MKHGVIYLLTGTAHAARLVVSLWTLRKHYDGPITVYTTRPESHEIGRHCAADSRLGIDHRTLAEVNAPKNSTYLTKVQITTHSPYELTVYLDADTVVAGDISELLRLPDEPFCVTQFSNWLTTDRILRRRIEPWRQLIRDCPDPEWLKGLVVESLRPHPAVNVGVFAFRQGAKFLDPWWNLAWLGRDTFICDEIALQLLLPYYPHRLLDCRYNGSPTHSIKKHDVRIWHFHGEKHLRREEGKLIWLPPYQECVRNNVAGLSDWAPAEDLYLRKCLDTNVVSFRSHVIPWTARKPRGQ